MTDKERTKLIRHLKYNRSIGADYLITDKDVDEIIKALEQEPCEDCISRQAVLDATVNRNSIWNTITNSKGENLEEIISQLPSVNPQPKIGYWIHLGGGEYACSECGEVFLTEGSWEKLTDIYCRSCGTTMEESQ